MSLPSVVLILLVLASVIGGGLGYYGERYRGGIWIGASGLLLIVLIAVLVTERF
jgi:hypothetical protein